MLLGAAEIMRIKCNVILLHILPTFESVEMGLQFVYASYEKLNKHSHFLLYHLVLCCEWLTVISTWRICLYHQPDNQHW